MVNIPNGFMTITIKRITTGNQTPHGHMMTVRISGETTQTNSTSFTVNRQIMLGFLYPKHVEILFEDSNREFRTDRYLNKKPEIQLGVEYCFSGCVLMSISRQLKNRTFGTTWLQRNTWRFSCVLRGSADSWKGTTKKNEKHDTRFTPDLNVLLHLLRRIQTQSDSMWRTFSWHFGVHYGPMAIPTPFSLPFTKPWASIMSQKCGFRFSLVARETKLNFRKGLSHILGPF